MKAIFAATASTISGEFILTPEVVEENADFLAESAEAGILTVFDDAGQEIFPNHEGIYKPRDLVYLIICVDNKSKGMILLFNTKL